MNFIKLTGIWWTVGDEEYDLDQPAEVAQWVNPDHISVVKAHPKTDEEPPGSSIFLSDGSDISVKESPEQIFKIIEDLRKK